MMMTHHDPQPLKCPACNGQGRVAANHWPGGNGGCETFHCLDCNGTGDGQVYAELTAAKILAGEPCPGTPTSRWMPVE
jgi:DnaJ-class molecular chaperone